MYSTTLGSDLTMVIAYRRGVQKNLFPATTLSVGCLGIRRPDRRDSKSPSLPPHNARCVSYNRTFWTVHGREGLQTQRLFQTALEKSEV